MGNTITQPITYGPHIVRNPRIEEAIKFLEDENNNDKPIPPNLLLDYELDYFKKHGRLRCAQFLRRHLEGGTIG